ncbi:MAG TPA: DUF4394 domain-containing protein [Thermoanaerobaculia bacterium]|nr:DUF4394 domain-containing protein [Thermoanaerobaculia bacterium]
MNGRAMWTASNAPRSSRDLGEIEIRGGDGDDTELIGIDYRVQNGLLYGVGNGGGVFVIDTNTAVATFVSELTVALLGTSFGVDFNPAADRLRIISDTGQNLAHNLFGTTTDNGTLTYVAPPAAAVAAPGVTGAAYTNNDFNQSSTGTTLFDLDTNLDQIASSEPASRSRTTPSPCSRSAATGSSTRSSSQPGRRPASARSTSPWWTSRFH